MGMNITNCWKLFCYGVKRDHYYKWISIRYLFEQLDLDCFNSNFPTDIGTPAKNIPPLDEVDEWEKVSTCRALHFYSSIYPSAVVRKLYEITLSSASSISYTSMVYTIGYQHIAEIEEHIYGGRYNRQFRGYCSGRLNNGKICFKRTLWFCNGCDRFNNKTYYCQQVVCGFFSMHHDSLFSLPWHVCSCHSIFFSVWFVTMMSAYARIFLILCLSCL